MEKIQKKLDELYSEYLNNILNDPLVVDGIENYKISSPLFIDLEAPQSNYKRPFKVLYVGKETNGWFNQKERNDVGLNKIDDKEKYLFELKSLYRKFNIGEKYSKPIFNFLDILIEQIQENYRPNGEDSTGFLWTNLIRHSGDYGTGKILPQFEKKIMYNKNEILRKEIEILKPNAIVFVTGPNYDWILKETFEGIKINPIKNFNDREIASLEHSELPSKAIRVFHPDYQNRLGGYEYMKELSQDIIDYFKSMD